MNQTEGGKNDKESVLKNFMPVDTVKFIAGLWAAETFEAAEAGKGCGISKSEIV